MYFTLNILGRPIKALVESGATRTFIGPLGSEFVKITTWFLNP